MTLNFSSSVHFFQIVTVTHSPLLFAPEPAGLAALMCALGRQREMTAALGEINESLKESAQDTRALHNTLRRQRGAVNDIHRYLMAVSKGSARTPR